MSGSNLIFPGFFFFFPPSFCFEVTSNIINTVLSLPPKSPLYVCKAKNPLFRGAFGRVIKEGKKSYTEGRSPSRNQAIGL